MAGNTKVPGNETIIPTVDERPGSHSDSEFDLLGIEAAVYKRIERELAQRYWLRWVAVVVAMLLIVPMGMVLFQYKWHFSDAYFEPSLMYHVASGITPIVSMTAIAIALLVVAFSRYRDDDKIASKSARAAEITADNIDKAGVS